VASWQRSDNGGDVEGFCDKSWPAAGDCIVHLSLSVLHAGDGPQERDTQTSTVQPAIAQRKNAEVPPRVEYRHSGKRGQPFHPLVRKKRSGRAEPSKNIGDCLRIMLCSRMRSTSRIP
jgi:hypothetical protein